VDVCDPSRRSAIGDVIAVHYTAWTRKDGVVFDSSIRRGDPLEFMLGRGFTIKGWEEGLLEMCIGAQRRLTVPAGLAVHAVSGLPYVFADGVSVHKFPPETTFVFDIELLQVKRHPDPRLFDPTLGMRSPHPNGVQRATAGQELGEGT
jgi:FKBP-type peptidyl-prolyl cis-trans isomerase